MENDAVLRGVRAATIEIVGYIRRGSAPRDLSHDLIEFTIFDLSTEAPILSKQSGSGITQDSWGNYRVTLQKEETSKANFPNEEYGYEVWLTTQPDGSRRRIERDLFLMDSSTK